MKPSVDLKARVDSEAGTILLEGHARGNLIFLGSSLETSLTPSEMGSTLTIVPPANGTGIVAIRFEFEMANSFILEVKGGDAPHINLEESWAPRAGRLLQIVNNNRLVYREDGQIFTSATVPDPNLLCRRAVGEAELQDVLDLVQETEAEVVEVEHLRRQVEAFEAGKRADGKLLDNLEDEISRLKASIVTLERCASTA